MLIQNTLADVPIHAGRFKIQNCAFCIDVLNRAYKASVTSVLTANVEPFLLESRLISRGDTQVVS